MKYQNISSFQKHLISAAPDNLCRFYLALVPDDFERAKVIDEILSFIKVPPTRFVASDCDLPVCLDAIQSMSLFGVSVVVLDELEKLSKKQLQTLSDHLNAPAGFVLFGSRSKTPLAPFIEKEGVILDLLEEKPWDREKRLLDGMIVRARQAGKQLSHDGSSLLLERLGVDPALLNSEIDKLICYVGMRPSITREDILAISPSSKTATLWQTAEDVIWERGEFPLIDGTTFHGILSSLKSQLHLGLTLASLIEEKCPPDEWNRFLPKIWPKTLEKRSSQAARLGSSYFRKGLDKLFEIELLSRSSSTQYRALLDLFKGYLHGR